MRAAQTKEPADMEDREMPNSCWLLADEWAEEVNKLTERFREGYMTFRIQLLSLDLCANGFLPHVDKQTIHLALQRQSNGLADGALSVSLPESEEANYWKCANESGEVFLSVEYRLRDSTAKIEIATSEDFFYLVTGEA